MRHTTGAVLAFAALHLAASTFVEAPSIVMGILLTVLISAPLIWWAYEYQLYVKALDELQSLLSLQAIAISAGVALMIGAVWNVAEKYLGVPHLNAAMLLPIAVLVHATVLSYLARRYQ